MPSRHEDGVAREMLALPFFAGYQLFSWLADASSGALMAVAPFWWKRVLVGRLADLVESGVIELRKDEQDDERGREE